MIPTAWQQALPRRVRRVPTCGHQRPLAAVWGVHQHPEGCLKGGRGCQPHDLVKMGLTPCRRSSGSGEEAHLQEGGPAPHCALIASESSSITHSLIHPRLCECLYYPGLHTSLNPKRVQELMSPAETHDIVPLNATEGMRGHRDPGGRERPHMVSEPHTYNPRTGGKEG